MKLAEFTVKRPQLTLVVFGMLAALGVHSLLTIPRAEDPSFPAPNFVVVAVYPGASPEEIERLVVDPIEDAVEELDEIKSVKTKIEDGVAVTIVECVAEVSSDDKFEEVQRQIDSVRPKLPETLRSLEVAHYNTNDVAILQLALVSETVPYKELEARAEDLRSRLRGVRGVKDVKTWAYPEQEVEVELDQEKLAQLRIPASQVIGAIQGANASIPGGSVDIGKRRLNIETSGSFASVDELSHTVVGGGAGNVVELADVARVDWGYAEQKHIGRFGGKRAAFVTVMQKDKQNIFEVHDAVMSEVDAFTAKLPKEVSLEIAFDQSQNVSHRLGGLVRDFIIAILLVLVTLLPLGLRASLIVMVSIPLSLSMGLTLLHLAGFSVNQLSIVGFVIALGLLVDDSIVVTENVTRFLRLGYDKRTAAIEATKQIGVAVLGCTATLIFAFLPLLFLPGAAGQFIRSMPLAVVFTILASLVVSLTVIPFFASVLLSKEEPEGNAVFRFFHKAIEASYRPVLHFAIRRPKSTLALAALAFGGSLALIPSIGFSLFPKAGTPQFLITIEAAEGANMRESDLAVRFTEEILASKKEIRRYTSNVGRGNPQIYYNVASKPEKASTGEILAELYENDPKKTPAFFDALREELAAYPAARIELKELENGPPIDAPIAIRVLGADLEAIKRGAGQVEEVLLDTEGTIYVKNPVKRSKTNLAVKIERARAGQLGVTELEIERNVRLAIAGIEAGKMRTASGDEHPITVSVPNPDLDALSEVHVPSLTGALVPLSQLAHLELRASPNLIQHYNGQRSVTLTAHVRTGYNTDRITKAILAKLEHTSLPEGTRWVAAGEIESRKESFGGLGAAILIAAFGVLAILVLEFKTFKSTLIVASVIPLGVVGGLVILFLSGYTLSFTAMIGFIALIGIEVKNSILLVDFTNQLREAGTPLDEAIERAGEARFFPILLTTLTAIGGLLPLALEGSSLYSPLALVVMGGLVSSTLLARLVTPVMYKLLAPQVERAEEPLTSAREIPGIAPVSP
jgi:multidrug efflux pump subunit AcrB